MERLQLNLRMDGQAKLLEKARSAAKAQELSLNAFVVNAIKTALNEPNKPLDTEQDDALTKAIDDRIAIALKGLEIPAKKR